MKEPSNQRHPWVRNEDFIRATPSDCNKMTWLTKELAQCCP